MYTYTFGGLIRNNLFAFRDTLRESLTIEGVLATQNSRELKKRTENGLYVRGRSDHYSGSSQFKSRGGTGVHRVQDKKCAWFKVKLEGAQGDYEADVFQVNNDDDAVAQRQLEDKQLEETTNTD
ncbi:hypothetical protein Tco_1005227 [Tanacetum coccineum]|uniref:Uncharacterized protein n=1 Tax=Tanacetum coccineum TaxID=301880 RepID=A0ABQ5FEV3_9ASTR